MTFVFLTVSLRWMITLAENAIAWKLCCICGNHYKVVKDLDRQSIYRYSSTRGCLVCTYRDRKEIYYKALVKNFEIDDEKDFLKSFDADIFFDDQKHNILEASSELTSGHVPYGIKNKG